jgi:hypothetical protein
MASLLAAGMQRATWLSAGIGEGQCRTGAQICDVRAGPKDGRREVQLLQHLEIAHAIHAP